VTIAPESLPDDIAALKRIIAEMASDATTAKAEIAKLKFQLARYRRAEFGRSSEKLAREIEQLELAIESLETDQAERLTAASPVVATAIGDAVEKQKPARRALPEHLPREEVRHPAACICPHCGGGLRRIGEEVSETLDYVPGRFKVIRHVREKLSCRACDTVIAAPAPDHAIARGRAGAGLLAHIVVSKFDDHLPLYRQAEIFAREGVSLETSTLSGWVGATAAALKPLVDALAVDIFAGDTLYVDDTPCRYWRRARARPRPAGCGPMFATSGRLPAPARRRRCSSIRPTARASTQGRICGTSRGSSTPTAMPGSTDCSPATGSQRPPAGPMSAANSSTSMPPMARRSPSRPRPHRRSPRGRKDDYRPAARTAPRRTPEAINADCRGAGRLG
jgi:transposase